MGPKTTVPPRFGVCVPVAARSRDGEQRDGDCCCQRNGANHAFTSESSASAAVRSSPTPRGLPRHHSRDLGRAAHQILVVMSSGRSSRRRFVALLQRECETPW